MQKEIEAFSVCLDGYTVSVQRLVQALQGSANVWCDKKYTELSSEITKMTNQVSNTISYGDDLVHTFREYQRCAEEEFD